jgi:hypothetical protein
MSKARQLADLGNVYDDGALSNRNMVINGGMTISQRNSSWSGLTASQYTLDRFSADIGGGGAIDVAQSTTAADGFVNSMSLTVATADASIAAGDAYRVSHQIEGLNVGHLNWGSSSAQTVTLSFWVRSSITGTYGLGISNSAETENYVAEYIINSANTWEKKTVTVEGRTSGTWLTTNGIGLGIRWDLGSGTNYNGTAGSWQTTGSKVYRTSSCVNWIANAGATFYLTGVQLEVGDTATPFEHRSYGDELQRCFRYYEQWDCVDGENIHLGTSYNGQPVTAIKYVVRKRASPTITLPTAGQTSGTISFLNGTGGYPTTTGTHSTSQVNNRGARIASSGYSGITSAQPAMLYTNGSTIFKFDAEL